jgi:hypothetical protein
MNFKDFIKFSDEDEVFDFLSDLSDEEYDNVMDFFLDDIDVPDDFDDAEYDYDDLDEALTILGRRKRGAQMKRMARKLQRAKAIKSKKSVLTRDEITRKARRKAVNILRQKWGKGKDDIKTKERIEQRLKRSKAAIEKLAKKQIKIVMANKRDSIKAKRDAKEQESKSTDV